MVLDGAVRRFEQKDFGGPEFVAVIQRHRSPATTQPRDARRNRLDNRFKTHCETMEGVSRLDSPKPLHTLACGQFRRAHHALCSQWVSCTLCQTARRFKGLARRFLKACVSGCALARGFLVAAPPVSASWKPFPGAEKQRPFREASETGSHSARVRADERRR